MKYYALSAVLILLILLFSAGCIIELTDHNLPSEEVLSETLDRFSENLVVRAEDVDKDLADFAHDLEHVLEASPENIQKILNEYYIDNIRISYAAYYDSVTDRTYVSPLFDTSDKITKSIFEDITFDKDETKLYGPIQTQNHGTICAFVHPIYRGEEVTGIVVRYNDPIDYITDSAVDCGGLNGLGSVIIDSDGYVFYSPFAADIGRNIGAISPESYQYIIAKQISENEEGITEVFKGYTPGLVTTKINKQAAWKTVEFGGKKLRVAVGSTEKSPKLPVYYKPDYTEMENAVREVYIYAFTNGKEKTIEALNDGTFEFDNFDLCAFDVDGTILASQKRPYQVGSNFVNWRSAYGIKTVETWGDIALTNGGGYHYFTISNSEDPSETKGTMCASYIIAVDPDWYLVSLIPTQAEPVDVDLTLKNSLLETMQKALRMYNWEGIDYALEKYMNREGTQLEGDSNHIVVLDKSGNVLSSNIPSIVVGSNAMDLKDYSTGVSLTRLLILKAESGGGFTAADFLDPEKNEEYGAVIYVEPLNDGRLISVSGRSSEFISHKRQYLEW